MTQEEADAIISEFLDMAPGWCRRARRAEKITREPFCPVCGISSENVEALHAAIKTKKLLKLN